MTRPIVGIPILNRLDLLKQCLASVDFAFDIFIVNNNGMDPEFSEQLDEMAKSRGATVMHQNRNIGFSGSVNLIMKTAMDNGFDSAFIAHNDVVLPPGCLQEALGMRHRIQAAIYHVHAFCCFLLSKATIEEVGWWDENFYPAYEEDIDYIYRCRLANVRRVIVPGPLVRHHGSATIASNKAYFLKNGITHGRNREYYFRKWGGYGGHEVFRHPFDDSRRDYRWWPPVTDRDGGDWDMMTILPQTQE